MNKQELIEKIEDLETLGLVSEHINKKEVLDLVELLDEPQKPTIPQFVANIIEGAKEENPDPELGDTLQYVLINGTMDFAEWFSKKSNRELFARACILGYTVEKEKLYQVRLKKIAERMGYLNRLKGTSEFMISYPEENNLYATKFTRKELEDAGFSEVFNSPLFEVEEVE
jgi:hypothetical protein